MVLMSLLGCSEQESKSSVPETYETENQVKIEEPKVVILFSEHEGQLMTNQAVKDYETKYKKASLHKAFSQSNSGAWSWRSNRTSIEHAKNNALLVCQKNNKKLESLHPCKIVNIDGQWVNN